MNVLDFEFALRFLVWSSTVATAVVVGHWVYRYKSFRVAGSGIFGKAIGWTIHQFYWFQSWLAFSSGNLALHKFIQSHKWIVFASEVIIVASTMLVLSPYLEARLGKYWGVYASAIVALLMVIGVTVGYPDQS